MNAEIVTRFAPSPTGFLHIGGARTALFNWLFARSKGGKMRLRIEDTDRARSSAEAVRAILDGLAWLGIDHDEEPVSQAARADRHREVANQLLAEGNAYHCYATPEELDEMREAARREGRPPRYDGRWRDRAPSATGHAEVAPTLRLRAPRGGTTSINDQVQGPVNWQNADLDDFVLLRSDGSPTYMLAVVVDDHDMGVTHIIRGDDHLTNAARQSQIYAALKWDVPIMAHIPLIHGPDGAKLSKRHGALGIESYRDMGYLPAALRNYLVRLGWSHGDDEIFTTDQAIEWFDLAGIGKAAARFDFAKLEHINAHYLRMSADTELLAALQTMLSGKTVEPEPHVISKQTEGRLLAAMDGLKPRAKTLIELWDNAAFIRATRPLSPTAKAKSLIEQAPPELLPDIYRILQPLAEWQTGALEQAIRAYVVEANLKLGKVAQPLRAALTGSDTSPGIFDVLTVLGRDESLARIRDQIGEDQIAGTPLDGEPTANIAPADDAGMGDAPPDDTTEMSAMS